MASAKTTILKKILVPILLVMIFQAVMLFGVLTYGGTLDELRQNAYDIFSEKVAGNRDRLQNEMIQRWSNVGESMDTVLTGFAQYLEENELSAQALLSDSDAATGFLAEVAPDLLYLLRKNTVNGAFIVLNNTDATYKSCLYFRDPDPNSNPSDYSDLQVERGSSSITKSLNIALGSYWTPQLDMTSESLEFFTMPLQAAAEHPDFDYADLGYWSAPFYLNHDSTSDSNEVITYSVPILYGGQAVGVLGIEVFTNYIQKTMLDKELTGSGKGGFLLAIHEDGAETYIPVVHNGALLTQILLRTGSFTLTDTSDNGGFSQMEGTLATEPVLACVQPLRLYNTYTPFESQRWVLLGVTYKQELLRFSNRFQTTLLLVCLLFLVIGTIAIVVVARKIARPISLLSGRVKAANPNQPIVLPRLRVEEIDDLSASIEYLSAEAVGAAGKLSRILSMTDVSIGAFEYSEKNDGNLFVTERFFPILSPAEDELITGSYMNVPQFKARIEAVLASADEVERERGDMRFTFRFDHAGAPYWSRLKLIRSGERTLGVVTDVTQEMLEKRRIEYDRDYDILTNLYNRRAFHTNMQQLMEEPERLKIAALIMMDLDNLKFINDSYGHDLGDEYIRSAAGALKKAAGRRALTARLSGDEFVIFLYGFDSKEEIRAVCSNIQSELQQTIILLTDGSKVPIRASAGLAWYPDDARTVEELTRYADFAMYMIKRTNKGQFTDFNIEVYQRESYLLHGKEELNLILEQGLVDYHFQPIFDAQTGRVYGYEALMRPRSETLRTPLELLSLARSQSKLPQVERLTLFRSMACFTELDIAKTDARIFINSIASQALSETSLAEFEQAYQPYLSRIVIELTEEERGIPEIIRTKQAWVKKWDAAIALDDFGVGFNGETALIEITPQFIKLDISIVKNIHTDHNRQQILNNLIAYSRERGIRVIAEGVEYKEDMETLIAAGVDYLQGYYLAKPNLYPQLDYPRCVEEIQAIRAALAGAP